MKKGLFVVFSLCSFFMFCIHGNATVIAGKCIYDSSNDPNIDKIELEFPLPSGNAVYTAYIRSSWQVGGSATPQSISLENGANVSFKYRNENHVCPAYVVTAVGNWLHNNTRKYYAVYSNDEYQTVMNDNKSWAGDFYLSYYSSYEEVDDGANPDGNPRRQYKKEYYPSLLSSSELGDLTFSLIYNEVEANFQQQTLTLSKYSGAVNWISSYDVSGFIKNVLNPIISSGTYPSEFWCGTIRAYLNVSSSANFILGASASYGDVVCSLEKDLFLDSNNTLIHYKTEREKPGSDSDSSDNIVNIYGGSSAFDVNVNTITTGQVCVNPNLKVVLKYIGWLISAVKLIIPFALIVLGIIDFMKAVTSQKPEELSKAVKTLLVRGISGVLIFFLPILVNFIFTLVDDWSDYKTAYSECTVCLSNPKKC